MQKMTREEFLARTNQRCRQRLFGEREYQAFLCAVAGAEIAAGEVLGYYEENNAGGVANAYKNTTTTARWGVYVDPTTKQVVTVVDRCQVSGPNVKCVRNGGERAYHKAWRDARAEDRMIDRVEQIVARDIQEGRP